MNPMISVVIPVKNEAAKISACLDGILRQTVSVHEIIIIDSGSTDGTQSIAQGYEKVKLIEIAPSEFNHGSTRNLGVELAEGDFVLMTVGDAKPASSEWIAQLMLPFEDATVAAVCGSQIVEHSKDTNPAEWFRPVSNPTVSYFQFKSSEQFNELHADKKRAATGWDDVTAMYRNEIIRNLPYRHVTYGEDIMWAVDALCAGLKLSYNPAARVYHYHVENYDTLFKKSINVLYLRYALLGYVSPTAHIKRGLFRATKAIIKSQGISIVSKFSWFFYNFIQLRAISDSIRIFNAAIKKGDDDIAALHAQYCGSPPIPLKAKVE